VLYFPKKDAKFVFEVGAVILSIGTGAKLLLAPAIPDMQSTKRSHYVSRVG
jgi:hypothetical protein